MIGCGTEPHQPPSCDREVVYFDGTAEGASVNGLYATDAYTPGTLGGTVTAG